MTVFSYFPCIKTTFVKSTVLMCTVCLTVASVFNADEMGYTVSYDDDAIGVDIYLDQGRIQDLVLRGWRRKVGDTHLGFTF